VTFDANGNTLTDASGRTYTWDSENRMTSCTYNGDTTTYTYGYDGLRRSSTKDALRPTTSTMGQIWWRRCVQTPAGLWWS
jgi:hypothetical protein